MGRPLISLEDVLAVSPGGTLAVPPGALITPLAQDAITERGIQLVETAGPAQPRDASPGVVAIGADHGGFSMKEDLKSFLRELGYSINDVGAYSEEAVDYPDFAYAVARQVAQGEAWRGILVDGAGIGSCMAANKVPGVRAAMCYNEATAINSREHNNANVLTLGSKMLEPYQARQIVQIWLATGFGGGRHARRVDKIMDIERRYLKG
ncbi:MAG: ribose 5-phosphate isomerase B [Anaerolineae bacterium]